MKGRNWVVLIVVACGLLILVKVLFGDKDSKENLPSEKDDGIVIGFSLSSIVIDRWQRDRDVFVATAKELGAEVIVQTANEDKETQIKQIEYLMKEGVDVLVINPDDKDGLSDVVRRAKAQGIKVIAYDRSISNADVDVYVSFDNQKLGRLMGETMLEYVPTGNYVIINGSLKDNNSIMYNVGFHEAIDEAVENKDITIIKEVWGEDWGEEIAYTSMEEVIQSGEKVDGVIAANDRFAEAAIRVLAENRQAGDVVVIGHDAELSACQRIVEGTQKATIYKSITDMAEGAARLAIDLANGKEINFQSTYDDGTYEVPRIMYDVFIVTNDNMVDIIVNKGFHRLEDIYQNVPKEQWPK
ncbi:MAG: D-xylose transporter subunit XylF [Firmicutes bacterium HGW-Firmicutes-1]|jgi:D-xylose transport system substrate-binding protein|nr:MAG: D-xylose transporter subunit XylF [Firmicutes bacterium HGW-Firmicutes-1]